RMNLGNTLMHLGEPVRAQRLFREALTLYQSRNCAEGIVWALERLAVVEVTHGDARKAARMLGAAPGARDALGVAASRLNQADWERALAATRAGLGEDVFVMLWAEGRALS